MIQKLSKTTKAAGQNEEGATLVEFAIIAPTFMLLLMGVFDFGHNAYMRSVLNGAIQEAARDSALENAANDGGTDAIDARIKRSIKALSNSIDVDDEEQLKITRTSYFSFDDVDRAEAFTDDDGDSICNNNEVFEDENGNGIWDEDVGEDGIGGARDIVVFEVAVTYDRLFPFYKMVGIPQSITQSSSTVLQNQPYAQQSVQNAATPGVCT